MDFKIRDLRSQGWFWIDNDFIDTWGGLLGATAIAIYTSLARHANNKTQESFPSEELIAKEIGVSDRTIRNHINKLEYLGIVRIQRAYNPYSGQRKRNLYTLQDKSRWKKPEEKLSRGVPLVPEEKSRRKNSARDQRKGLPNNNPQKIKETDYKETKGAELRSATAATEDVEF
jgi:DNA-binding transcriptional ArsR family regulator